MNETKTLDEAFLEMACPNGHRGHLRPGTTTIEFHREYVPGIRTGFRIVNVPAYVCDVCGEVVITPGVESRLWAEFRELEASQEFQRSLENEAALLKSKPQVRRAIPAYHLEFADL